MCDIFVQLRELQEEEEVEAPMEAITKESALYTAEYSP